MTVWAGRWIAAWVAGCRVAGKSTRGFIFRLAVMVIIVSHCEQVVAMAVMMVSSTGRHVSRLYH